MLSVSKRNVTVTLAVASGVAALTAGSAMALVWYNRKTDRKVSVPKRVAQVMSTITVLCVVALLSVMFVWDDVEAAKAEERFTNIVEPIFKTGIIDPIYGQGGEAILPREAVRRLNHRMRDRALARRAAS